MAEPAVSVIVAAKDAEATIARTLQALARQDLPEPYEVIVVDDGSTDRTAEIARDAGVRVVRQPTAGPGPARNAGAAAARAPRLAFTDADCFPEPGWLAAGLRALDDADLVQGMVVADPGAERGPWDRTVEVGGPHGLFETANLLIDRELFDSLGGFEVWIEPRVGTKPYGEDVWLGWRARRARARVKFEPRAVVAHAVFRRGPSEWLAERRTLRNMPPLVRKLPELRAALLYRRLFLTRRTALFDAAATGLAVAALRRTPLPLLLALPYARLVWRESGGWPRRSEVALVSLAGDLIGLHALARGSIDARTVVL